MFKNILVAYDGSEHSKKAALIVGGLIREQHQAAEVRIVTVLDPAPWELGEPFLSHLIEQRTRAGDEALAEAAGLIGEGITTQKELLFGGAAEGIIQVAEARGCDLIVIGERGLGLLEGLLLGSQAQRVISRAKCPVLVVK
jgi:nucleotide-binding universal stress UspA family protein